MNKKIFLIFSIFITLFISNSYADSTAKSDELINNFLEAYKSQDLAAIENTWNQINNDPATLIYLENNKSHEHSLFKLQGIAINIQELKEKYVMLGNRLPSVSAPSVAIRPLGNQGTLQGNRSNSTISSDFSNQKRHSNRIRNQRHSDFSNSRISRSNGQVTRNYDNQDRVNNISNQKRLKQRRRR